MLLFVTLQTDDSFVFHGALSVKKRRKDVKEELCESTDKLKVQLICLSAVSPSAISLQIVI